MTNFSNFQIIWSLTQKMSRDFSILNIIISNLKKKWIMVYYINRENNTLLLKGILHTPLFILIKMFSTVLPYLTVYNAQHFAQKIHWTSYVCIIHKNSVRLYTNTCATLIILWNIKRWVYIIYKCVLNRNIYCMYYKYVYCTGTYMVWFIYKCVLYRDIYGMYYI